jgi:hypothetical protein
MQMLAICFVLIAKRYIELRDTSEINIENGVLQRAIKDLNGFLISQTDVAIIFTVADKPNQAIFPKKSNYQITLQTFNPAAEDLTGIKLANCDLSQNLGVDLPIFSAKDE